jgi:hypothetical protein
LRGGLHTLIVAYDTTSAQSLETARAWIKEIKKLNPPIVGTLLAFHPTQSTDGIAAASSPLAVLLSHHHHQPPPPPAC